jgi:hypothetical protein
LARFVRSQTTARTCQNMPRIAAIKAVKADHKPVARAAARIHARILRGTMSIGETIEKAEPSLFGLTLLRS